MNYKDRFIKALAVTKKPGLEIEKEPLPFKKPLSKNKLQSVLCLCVDVLKYRGYYWSSDLAKKCIPVHLDIKHFLKLNLNIDSFITIGDRYWDDYVYCEMSYDGIHGHRARINSQSGRLKDLLSLLPE